MLGSQELSERRGMGMPFFSGSNGEGKGGWQNGVRRIRIDESTAVHQRGAWDASGMRLYVAARRLVIVLCHQGCDLLVSSDASLFFSSPYLWCLLIAREIANIEPYRQQSNIQPYKQDPIYSLINKAQYRAL